MKRFGLFLLAAVLPAVLAGCTGEQIAHFLELPTYEDMAGVYHLTKMTTIDGGDTVTRVPPEISGTITLTRARAYTLDTTISGERIAHSGIYTISPYEVTDTAFLLTLQWEEEPYFISDGGRKLASMRFREGVLTTIEFRRS